jgi:hypothetical protein
MDNNNNNPEPTRRKLSDILNGGGDSIRSAWDTTQAASDFAPLPAGTYIARIVKGELATAKSGTAGYKLAFRVLEGQYTGRQFWHDVWLTPAALPMAKRDLGKLGITSLEQLEKPLPPGILVKAKLSLRKDDNGGESNQLKTFEVVGIDSTDDAGVTGPITSAIANSLWLNFFLLRKFLMRSPTVVISRVNRILPFDKTGKRRIFG